MESCGLPDRGFAQSGFRAQVNQVVGMIRSESAALIFPNGKRSRAVLILSLFPVIHVLAILLVLESFSAARYPQTERTAMPPINLSVLIERKRPWQM